MSLVSPFSRTRFFVAVPLALALTLSLSACEGKKKHRDLAELDEQLAGNSADPALRGAVEDNITVDPDLVGQSNRNSIRPADKPFSGTVPGGSGQKPSPEELVKLAGGSLMQAPAATSEGDTAPDGPVTLGGLAKQQAEKDGKSKCPPVKLAYANAWAGHLPTAFPYYPQAQLVEAAGAGSGICGLRAVTFRTQSSVQEVLDFYYSLAKRGGYSAERLKQGAQDVMGGTKSEAAYYLVLEPARGGGTTVDLIVNNGI